MQVQKFQLCVEGNVKKEWRPKIIDYMVGGAGGKQHGNQLAVSSVFSATLSISIDFFFFPPPPLLSDVTNFSEVKVTQRLCLQIGHQTCALLRP